MSAFRYDIVRAPDDFSRSFTGLLVDRTFYPTGEISRERQGTKFLAQLTFRAFELRLPNDQLSVGPLWSIGFGINVFEDTNNVPGCGSKYGVFTINYPAAPPLALFNGVFFFGKQAVQYAVRSGNTIVMNGLIEVQRTQRFPQGPPVPECSPAQDGTNGGNF
jgi:hypothetical protein